VAHAPSAIKRHRQSLRRRERNQAQRSGARSAVRKARELIAAGSSEAVEAVRSAASVLDRAARKGTLHPNNASRRKSRLMRQLNAASTPAALPAPRRGRAASTRPRAKKS
jgi:small subunit ribosomal protein S20